LFRRQDELGDEDEAGGHDLRGVVVVCNLISESESSTAPSSTPTEIRSKHTQNHGRKLVLPKDLSHRHDGEQQRRQTRPDGSDADEPLTWHFGSEESDEEVADDARDRGGEVS
jgi:hypothetical protein